MRPFRPTVCRECRIPIEPVRHHLIPREGRGADIRNLDVLLLSHQQYDQSRHGHGIYRLWGHRILHLHERSRRLQRDDARGHFRQIRRSDYEAARSICCWTSCSPFQIVGREPPDLGLMLRPFGSIQATAVQALLTASQGERWDEAAAATARDGSSPTVVHAVVCRKGGGQPWSILASTYTRWKARSAS